MSYLAKRMERHRLVQNSLYDEMQANFKSIKHLLKPEQVEMWENCASEKEEKRMYAEFIEPLLHQD